METFKRILVVIQPTEYSREVLMEGLSLARLFRANLSVARVSSNPVVDMEAINAPNLLFREEEYQNYLTVREQYNEDVNRTMQQVARDAVAIREYAVDKEPVKEILRIVKEQGIDLVVLLAHEEGRLERLLFKGENDELIRKLPCSTLLLKHEPQSVPWEAP